MNKLFALVLGVLLLLFLGITLLKNRSPGDDILDVTRVAAPAERARIQRFWELYRQATGHRIAGRTRQAVETYAGALELNTEHEDALYYLGNVYFDLGEFADAETAWKRLVDVNPTSARAHSQLGNLYLCFDYEELVDLEAAEAEFQRALDIYKEETGPLLRLGEIALIRGDVAQARYYFDAVTGSNYRSVEAHFLKGYLAWKERELRRAATLFAKTVEYAQPTEPAEGVLGEGDTKAGSAPLISQQRHCRGLRAYLDDLPARAGADLYQQMSRKYQQLDAWLEEVETKIPP